MSFCIHALPIRHSSVRTELIPLTGCGMTQTCTRMGRRSQLGGLSSWKYRSRIALQRSCRSQMLQRRASTELMKAKAKSTKCIETKRVEAILTDIELRRLYSRRGILTSSMIWSLICCIPQTCEAASNQEATVIYQDAAGSHSKHMICCCN